jgi:hypothetical protein
MQEKRKRRKEKKIEKARGMLICFLELERTNGHGTYHLDDPSPLCPQLHK